MKKIGVIVGKSADCLKVFVAMYDKVGERINAATSAGRDCVAVGMTASLGTMDAKSGIRNGQGVQVRSGEIAEYRKALPVQKTQCNGLYGVVPKQRGQANLKRLGFGTSGV